MDPKIPTDEDVIQYARDVYVNGDDLEIDDYPRLSKAAEGAWVAAWVWVSYSDIAGRSGLDDSLRQIDAPRSR